MKFIEKIKDYFEKRAKDKQLFKMWQTDNNMDFLKILEDERNELKNAPALTEPEKEKLQELEKKIAAKIKEIEPGIVEKVKNFFDFEKKARDKAAFKAWKKDMAIDYQENLIDMLYSAASKGDLKEMQSIIEKGADANATLYIAAYEGEKNAVQSLIKAGANVNIANSSDNTPLHMATMNGNKDIVQALVHAGAYVTFKNKEDQSALDLARKAENQPIVEVLDETYKRPYNIFLDFSDDEQAVPQQLEDYMEYELEYIQKDLKEGKDINFIYSDKATPLHVAAMYGEEDLVQDILKAGGNINAECCFKITPLHRAVQFKKESIVKILLNAGADTTIKNYAGETALDTAKEYGLEKIKVLLVHERQKQAFREEKAREEQIKVVQALSPKKEKVRQKAKSKNQDMGMDI